MPPRRYELSDFRWSIIQPLLPNKPREFGAATTARFERHLSAAANGLALVGDPGALWPPTTCGNRFRHWRKRGVWDRIFEAITEAYDGDPQMIDRFSIRVHQHGANGKRGARRRLCPGTLLTAEAWGARAAA